MAITFNLFLFILCSPIWETGYSASINTSPNPLNGKHLRVIWPRWSGNPKGIPGSLKAGVILECLTSRFNFTYEMIHITDGSLETRANVKGLFNYLWDKECDLLLQDVVPSYKYRPVVDITVPWVYTSAAILMPVPADSSLNINSLIKPFQWPIWLGVGISIVCVITVLNLLQQYEEKKIVTAAENSDGFISLPRLERPGRQYIYVFGNLLSQGGPCTSKRLPFRIVAGVWTLAAFIFVQAYNSTLFTYLVTPMNPPQIKSPYDIPENNEVRLLVIKGSPMDTALSNKNTTNELYKKLGERVNKNPDSRCYPVSQCINMLTPGSNNVFLDALNYHKDIIREQFKKTGKCNLQILAKEGFSPVMGSFALQKNSEYTKTVNQGLLEIMQAGLIDYWDVWFRPMPPQCQENIKSYKPIDSKALKTKDKSPALTFKNLTGAFIVLLLGLSLSFLTFLCELIISIPKRHTRRFQNGGSNSANLAGNTRNKPSAINKVENDIQEMNASNHTDKINKNESKINDDFETIL